jgi:hypothetical protein
MREHDVRDVLTCETGFFFAISDIQAANRINLRQSVQIRTNNRAVVFIDNEAEALAAVVKLIPAGKSRERQHGWLDASC